MHVVQLLPELNQGGVETIVLALNRELVLHGHRSTVISAGGTLVPQIESDGGQHIALDVCSKNPLTFIPRCLKLKTELLKLDADIIHTHSRVPAWLAFFARKRLDIPLVTTVHGFNSVGKYSAIMTKGDRVICVSHPVKAFIEKHYPVQPDSISVIHCGIDPSAFDPARIDRRELDQLKHDHALEGKRVVTSVGRITELKDYETFIRAIAIAAKTRPDIKALVVGHVREDKQSLFLQLQQLVGELGMAGHIDFIQDCPHMPELYAASSVVVSCSKKPESFGLTLVEALAMNIPVIATRHGGPLDIIVDGVNGSFFEPGDANALAELIVRDHPAGTDLRTDAIARFSLEKMVDSTESVYSDLVEPIPLEPSLFIAEGSHRAIYHHPEQADKCLKIVKAGSLEKRRQRNKKWYKRLRKLSSFDETKKDLQAYRQFRKRNTDLSHIPRFHGMVKTSLGPAMLLDLVTNEDGTPARSLASHLESTEKVRIAAALTALAAYLMESAIVVRDFSIYDVMVREGRDGSLKLFIIDGLGGKELIPLSSIRYFARLKAERRVRRFYSKILAHHPDLSLELK